MNPTALIDFVVDHGPTLLLGATILLGVGVLAVAIQSGPFARRWLGVRVAALLAGYLALAAVPLPRLALPEPAGVDVAASLATFEAVRNELSAPPVGRLRVPLPADHAVLATPAPVAIVEPASPTPALGIFDGLQWSRLCAWSWLCCAVGSVLWLGLGRLRMARILRLATPARSGQLAGLELPARTRVLFTSRAVRPFCCGVLRRSVVVPGLLADPARSADLHAVLRHEFAHLRAQDPAAQTLFALLLPLLFFHPLWWWLRREVRFASEVLADAQAVAGRDAAGYARALLALAQCGRGAPVTAVALFRRPSEFLRRMHMLLERESDLSMSMSRARRALQSVVVGVALVGCTAFLGVRAVAQDPQPPSVQQLREENAKLRAEVAELRAAIDRLSTVWSGQISTSTDTTGRVNFDKQQLDRAAAAGAFAQRSQNADGSISLFPTATTEVAPPGAVATKADAFGAARVADPRAEVQPEVAAGGTGSGAAEPGRIPLVSHLFAKSNGVAAGDTATTTSGDPLASPSSRSVGSAADNVDEVRSNPDRFSDLRANSSSGDLRRPATSSTASVDSRATYAEDLATSVARTSPQGASTVTDEAPTTSTSSSAFGPTAGHADELGSLVDLATRLIDLDAEVKLAQSDLATALPLVESGRASTQEKLHAELRLDAAMRKQKIVRSIVDAEIESSEADLARTKALVEQGLAPNSELRQLQRRLTLLRSVR